MIKFYTFETAIKGFPKKITMAIHESSGFVTIGQFRPEILCQSDIMVATQAGESVSEFCSDCKNIINIANNSSQGGIDAISEALHYVLASHIHRCGRLIFGDLMIYVDCCAHIIKSAGAPISDVEQYYSIFLGVSLKTFSDYIKDEVTLIPFVQTKRYELFKKHMDELSMKLQGKPFF